MAGRMDTMPDHPAMPPTVRELFVAFFGVGISGFGGVMPFARRMLVEQRRWLSAEEFTDALALCQVVPGPNIVNMAVALGARWQGAAGSIAAVMGVLAAPVVVVVVLGLFFDRAISHPVVARAFHGLSAVAAGMIVAMAIHIARPLVRRRDVRGLAMALVAFVAMAVLRLPLLPSLLVLIPIAIWLQRKPA